MDELNPFREFRSGAAPPSEQARQRASARLARAIDSERSPEPFLGERPVRVGAVSWLMKRPGYVVASLALVAAAAAALFVSAPWRDSPGFLARAQAALTPPPGSILHMKWETTNYSTNAQRCTVTSGPNEIWIDQTEPHRYHALFFNVDPDLPGDPRAHLCSKPTHYEYGGTFTSGPKAEWALKFMPPNKLTFQTFTFQFPWDPVGDIRQAISEGRAHDEGKTQLDGRTVERIRLGSPPCSDPNTASCPDASYYYVDPETFAPVELDAYATIAPAGLAAVHFRSVMRYLTFEYLPRTPANLALTSIRAQHPNATGP
jgi:hypothetical protein